MIKSINEFNLKNNKNIAIDYPTLEELFAESDTYINDLPGVSISLNAFRRSIKIRELIYNYIVENDESHMQFLVSPPMLLLIDKITIAKNIKKLVHTEQYEKVIELINVKDSDDDVLLSKHRNNSAFMKFLRKIASFFNKSFGKTKGDELINTVESCFNLNL